MIPLRDSIPRVHPSFAVWGLIALNALVFIFELGLPPEGLYDLFHLFGLVPARYSRPEWAMAMGYPPAGYLPFVSYMFLHAGWLHFLINMWMLWIFADNIEDVMGSLRFLAFYLLCGVAAVLAHMLSDSTSPEPVIGASGAVAGVMGAYFLLYPHSKVLTLIPILIIPFFVEIPAVLFLGLWFVSQFFSGVLSLGQGGGGVAFWAHAGGFVAGMLLLPLFRVKSRCYYCYRADGRRIPYRERGLR